MDAAADEDAETEPVALSTAFLAEIRDGQTRGPARERLAKLPEERLDALDRRGRLAFWLNVYNAAAHAALAERPERFENRRRFFSAPLVTVAGEELGLDTIEHGIIRHSSWKYGLGYVRDPFPSAFERRHRLSARDFRIHFALNCGAASCPAIAAYTAENVDLELHRSTATYLSTESVVDGDTVRVPRLMLWYRGDFGGRRGIKRILREYGVVNEPGRYRVRYRDYDWSLAVGRFHGE